MTLRAALSVTLAGLFALGGLVQVGHCQARCSHPLGAKTVAVEGRPGGWFPEKSYRCLRDAIREYQSLKAQETQWKKKDRTWAHANATLKAQVVAAESALEISKDKNRMLLTDLEDAEGWHTRGALWFAAGLTLGVLGSVAAVLARR